MGGLVHLAHLLWTHLLDQADYGRFAILEGVVFGFAAATVTLAPQQYVLVYVHKKPRSELAGDLGGVLGLAFVAGGLATLAILVLPDSFFVLGVEAIPRWAIAGVIVAATFATGRMMAQSIHETQSQPTRAAMWSDFVDGRRPFDPAHGRGRGSLGHLHRVRLHAEHDDAGWLAKTVTLARPPHCAQSWADVFR